MRKAPAKIPNKLPDVMEASRRLQKIVDRPNIRLADYSIGQLVELFNDGTPVWLTGSTAWLPAVFSLDPDRNNDYDVVFSSKQSCERFVKGALSTLNGRLPASQHYKVLTNKLGGSRIVHADGSHVIDAWFLGEGESIAELVMAYPPEMGEHIRVAYQISRSPNAGCLTRIVHIPTSKRTSYPRETARKPEPIFGKIKEKRVSSYYGFDD